MRTLRTVVATITSGVIDRRSAIADDACIDRRETRVITLHTFGPFLGAPDASPFVIKAMLLKLAGLPYVEKRGNPFSAPRGLLPYIEDEGESVADSTLIRFHLERKYRHDFDAALDAGQRAAAWCVEKMCEEHLYFALLHTR